MFVVLLEVNTTDAARVSLTVHHLMLWHHLLLWHHVLLLVAELLLLGVELCLHLSLHLSLHLCLHLGVRINHLHVMAWYILDDVIVSWLLWLALNAHLLVVVDVELLSVDIDNLIVVLSHLVLHHRSIHGHINVMNDSLLDLLDLLGHPLFGWLTEPNVNTRVPGWLTSLAPLFLRLSVSIDVHEDPFERLVAVSHLHSVLDQLVLLA
jgi:hypothetical protein